MELVSLPLALGLQAVDVVGIDGDLLSEGVALHSSEVKHGSQQDLRAGLSFAYADPPYPGMSHFYADHPDYAGEVDHAELIARMNAEYDAWALHTASVTLREVLALCPDDVRIGAWVKTFASFKKGVNPAYAWEPVIWRGGRNDSSGERLTVSDWFACPITLRKGLVGAKPREVVRWVFALVGLEAGDTVTDLYPGTGVVSREWEAWQREPRMFS